MAKKEARSNRKIYRNNIERNKKGLSPIVSTLILIMIVVVIAIIILIWARGFIKEVILKEVAGNSKTVDKYCSEVQLKPILNDDGTFGVTNEGSVPVFHFNLKLSTNGGSSATTEITTPINPGYSIMIDGYNRNDYQEVKVIPILLGKRQSGLAEPFTCPETNGIDI